MSVAEEEVDFEEGGASEEEEEEEEVAKEQSGERTEHKEGLVCAPSSTPEKTKFNQTVKAARGVLLNVLFVSKFRFGTTMEELKELMNVYGKTQLITFKETLAFVDFERVEDAAKAKESLHGSAALGSKALIVDFKKNNSAQYKKAQEVAVAKRAEKEGKCERFRSERSRSQGERGERASTDRGPPTASSSSSFQQYDYSRRPLGPDDRDWTQQQQPSHRRSGGWEEEKFVVRKSKVEQNVDELVGA